MNVNKNIINYSETGARLSYVDKNNGTNEDENDFNHYIKKDSNGKM